MKKLGNKYWREIESIWYLKVKCFENAKEAINYLKIIKFVYLYTLSLGAVSINVL